MIGQACGRSDHAQRQRGFTLVELITTIVVITILISIIIPNFIRIRRGAVEKKAVVNLHSMYFAQKEFRAEYGRYAGTGDEKSLQQYVDFSLEDGDWVYAIVRGDEDACLMKATDSDGREMQIDQTGSLSKRY